jgi:hypothetical protein
VSITNYNWTSDHPRLTWPNRISHCERHLLSSHRAKARWWLRRLAAGGAGAIVVGFLAPAGMPTASAQPELAGWLSRAIVPVSAIHTLESDALAATVAGPIDVAKLETACTGLDDARRDLQGQMPTPDQQLTVEVQQAIDNFETAAQYCGDVVAFRPDPNQSDEDNNNFLNYIINERFLATLTEAEQHLDRADAKIRELSAKG